MIELTLLALAASAEAVSDALVDELGALSVTVVDADAGSEHEQALFGEPGLAAESASWPRARIAALFTTEGEAQAAAAALVATAGDTLRVEALGTVEDQDWVRRTQAQFAPTEVGSGLWVVPSWHEPPAEATRVIRLDPGMAFGTGTHPTTRLCLRWLAAHAGEAERWRRVLDYGCGSGILAIGAALFGAHDIDAVDIDPQAIVATRANAHANGVTVHAGGAEAARGAYDLVLANILATPLKLLAPLLCGHLAPDGDLVLAGILERQVDELRLAYAPLLALEVTAIDDGWALMTGRRTQGRMA
jgi:ribosomal protein L11 methyltransferase